METLKVDYPDRIAKEVTCVTKDEFSKQVAGKNPFYLLHISDNKHIRKFYPTVSKRTLGTEDRSVPRICTSVSITHCIAGAGIVEAYFDDESFDGLFQVYGFKPNGVFKPSTKLVPDANQNREYWLVGKGVSNSEYVPLRLGQFFIHSIKQYRKERKQEYVIYISVKEEGLWLTEDHYLEPGYYCVFGHNIESKRKTCGMRKPMTVDKLEPIEKDEYDRHYSAYTLSTETISQSGMLAW